jgi:hypothetical protein
MKKSTSTLEKTNCGLVFILRFVTFSKCSNPLVELLDQPNIQHSSVNLVHFSWVEKDEDLKNNKDNKDDEDIENVNIRLPHMGQLPLPS